MHTQEKINFILEIAPNIKVIIQHAINEQIDKLYQDAHDRLNYALELA